MIYILQDKMLSNIILINKRKLSQKMNCKIRQNNINKFKNNCKKNKAFQQNL